MARKSSERYSSEHYGCASEFAHRLSADYINGSWALRSDSVYILTAGFPFRNTPNGSWGSFKVGLHRTPQRSSQIPPTGVRGSFKSSLHRTPSTASSNPTHGSGWIIQVQPTSNRRLLRIPPTRVGGSFKSSLRRGASDCCVVLLPLLSGAR